MNPDLPWSTREKLAIASYVFHTDDQHWTGKVSRLLRPLGDPDRPSDWFSPKHCAQQYTALVEGTESSRRKRPERSDSNDSLSSTLQVPTPSVHELVLRKATNERIEELKRLMKNERAKYKKISQTLQQLESGELDDELDSMYDEMQKQVGQNQELLSPITAADSNPANVPFTKEEKSASEQGLFERLSSLEPNISSQSTTEMTQETLSIGEMEAVSSTLDRTTGGQSQSQKDWKESEVTLNQGNPTSQSSIDKEDTITPATSPGITLPTPVPVIESDSSSEEDVEMDSGRENESSRPAGMEIDKPAPVDETPSIEQSLDNSINNSQYQDTLSPEVNVTLRDEVEPVAEINVVATETSISEPSISTAQTLAEEKTQEKTDLVEKKSFFESLTDTSTAHPDDESEVETISKPDKMSTVIDVIPASPAVETIKVDEPEPEESEPEVSDSHKNLDEEKTEEEVDDYGSSISSTPAYIESFPSSPALSTASDVDPEVTAQTRAWKKSIVILWKQVASHRYASLFLHPVTNEIAPNYSSIVLRPMDLSTLKRNVENGTVRTTSEFQRDLMLMFQNALMYNNCEHDVYKMTQDMQKDVMDQVEQFLATQLMMETSKQVSSKGLRRSTLRKSIVPVTEKASKRPAENEARLTKK